MTQMEQDLQRYAAHLENERLKHTEPYALQKLCNAMHAQNKYLTAAWNSVQTTTSDAYRTMAQKNTEAESAKRELQALKQSEAQLSSALNKIRTEVPSAAFPAPRPSC